MFCGPADSISFLGYEESLRANLAVVRSPESRPAGIQTGLTDASGAFTFLGVKPAWKLTVAAWDPEFGLVSSRGILIRAGETPSVDADVLLARPVHRVRHRARRASHPRRARGVDGASAPRDGRDQRRGTVRDLALAGRRLHAQGHELRAPRRPPERPRSRADGARAACRLPARARPEGDRTARARGRIAGEGERACRRAERPRGPRLAVRTLLVVRRSATAEPSSLAEEPRRADHRARRHLRARDQIAEGRVDRHRDEMEPARSRADSFRPLRARPGPRRRLVAGPKAGEARRARRDRALDRGLVAGDSIHVVRRGPRTGRDPTGPIHSST